MVVAVTARVIDLIVQLALIALGLSILLSEDDSSTVGLIALWGGVGFLYWTASVIAVGVSVRRGPERAPRWLARVELHPLANVVLTTATFVASLVGLIAAAEVLVLRDDPDWAGWVEPIAVSAMLLSWAIFHWGFARIYDRRHRLAPDDAKPLLFPGTPHPRLVDFVYFAFTNATAFSVSDVQVMTTRMRWTVVWHTTISFFLNALIIVLAFSTIMSIGN